MVLTAPIDRVRSKKQQQDYLERILNGYTCHFIRPEWKLWVRKREAKSNAAE